VRDDRAVAADQRVHSTQRVLPVGLGEVAGERVGDHLADALPGLAVEIGSVDQTGRVDQGVHSPCSTSLSTGPRFENAFKNASRMRKSGRAQCNRTCWPGRTWASLSMSSSITTPATG